MAEKSRLAAAIKGLPTVEGAGELFVPGEPEERVRRERAQAGIPLPPGTVAKLQAAAARFRLKLYSEFLLWKLRYHPLKVARQALNFSRRRFETKMEMVPYKALRWRGMESSAGRS